MSDQQFKEALKGKTIVFEGGEGCGKGTIAAMFTQHLIDSGLDVLSTREPGGSLISERIRELILDDESEGMAPLTEALLYAASRAQLIDEVLAKATAAEKTIVLDRFVQSSYVYQGIVEGVGVDTVKTINESAMGQWRPDLCIVLDVPVDVAQRRIDSREQRQDRFDRADSEFKEKIRQGYLSLARDYDDVVAIDASQPISAVFEQVLDIVEKHFCV